MAQNSLSTNVAQAISDFDGIRTALRGADVAVPDGTPTAAYGGLVTQSWSRLLSDTLAELPTQLTLHTSSVRSYAFAGMRALKKMDLTVERTSIGAYAFYLCGALSDVTLRSTDPAGLLTLGAWMFASCTALEKIVLPKTLTGIGGYCFSGCTALNLSALPEGITEIAAGTFSGCTGLTAFTLGRQMETVAPNAFTGCVNLKTITVNKPQGSLSGAPWGAVNAQIVWTG